MQMKIANIRREKTRINETHTSEKGQTQRAIRTLENKLDRVSHIICNKTLVIESDRHWMDSVSLFSVTSITSITDFVLSVIIQALTHFSEQLTKNSELRKELQTLHVEQIRFQQLQNRLEKVGPEICFSLLVFNIRLCVNVCFFYRFIYRNFMNYAKRSLEL